MIPKFVSLDKILSPEFDTHYLSIYHIDPGNLTQMCHGCSKWLHLKFKFIYILVLHHPHLVFPQKFLSVIVNGAKWNNESCSYPFLNVGTILEFFFIPVFPDPCRLNPKLSSKFLRLVPLPSKYFLNSCPMVLVSSSDPETPFWGHGRCTALLLTAWGTSATTRPSLLQCSGSSSCTGGGVSRSVQLTQPPLYCVLSTEQSLSGGEQIHSGALLFFKLEDTFDTNLLLSFPHFHLLHCPLWKGLFFALFSLF